MALIDTFEQRGNLLFKYRGYIPVALFLIAVPAMYMSDFKYYINDKTFTLIVVLALFFSCLGEIIRAYTVGTTPKGTSGRNRSGQCADSLNTTGIYSIVRHPLYLANYLMWLGVMIFTGSIFVVVVGSLLFFVYYERIMFSEERYLQRKFGEQFVKWAKCTSAFIPSFKNVRKSNVKFSIKSVIRREYSSVMALAISFMFVDLLRYLFLYKTFSLNTLNRLSVYITAFTVLLALVLRTIRHKTKILNEEGRS
ncbi:MAG: isoprenylcysteine carboxylmethyltransferase family protein [Bacteroidales bacterium]|jgi:protein-S-isoprenylcysteine O-methyltransferase Ste14|nr:isoprenylcysteine carboxylmethyltransferase family protein [Bacteroidales bacterium]MDD2204650.1 isoprenylcysteine carboxylmethyltransferase family protein [Bacteroidales bacterium]MDD3151328.1 isoprenylcysteine carboxylmethyltransferase family protein [Bacteroidales bacterium]MDD3913675.1 isoprenylcysteine carboxylmethyltransferase family protein [Bacteroidales bacterium]MDD4633926.1 isoprenylcysteine carboxylmethyltransferase family protein [Bacteroidales bacterium]